MDMTAAVANGRWTHANLYKNQPCAQQLKFPIMSWNRNHDVYETVNLILKHKYIFQQTCI